MDLLIWNCRGASNKRFKRNMRELVRIHKSDLLVLMETKVEFSAMGMFFNRMGFTTSAHVDPIGRSGGIWIVWNPNVVNVRVTECVMTFGREERVCKYKAINLICCERRHATKPKSQEYATKPKSQVMDNEL
ncbi:hypothetical protein LOK49_LG04G01246 [Camellia lanceoleosa]|uniref:Uncharacterized protein n=1 Tax=Camellia lanceoleosa TaxID=1840588 RepID=A0ACC0I215_9ERIC|nr:hypothetical protein LOK49_LG04G01246 [Camellia lanceoleosa]